MIDPLGVDWAVNQLDPADRLAPENAGLAAWYLALPEGMGGPTWRDLIGTGTLTLASGATWGPTTRPGGSGEVAFDGSSTGYAQGSPALGIAGAWSFALSARATGPDAKLLAYALSIGSGATFGLGFFLGGSLESQSIGAFDGTNLSYSDPNTFTTAADGGVWRRILFTYDSSRTQRLQVYKDGVPLPMATNALTGSSWTQGDLRLGGRLDNMSATITYLGWLDDVRAWPVRCLSDADAAIDLDRSRRGYPPC